MRIIAQLNWSSGAIEARPLALLRTVGDRVVDNISLDEAPAIAAGRVLLGKLRAALTSLPAARAAEPTVHAMNATIGCLPS